MFKMKSKRKKLLSGMGIALLLVLAAYLVYGHYLGKMVKEVVWSAYASHYDMDINPYADFVPDEIYKRLVRRDFDYWEQPDLHDWYRLNSPFVIWWPTGAKVHLRYSYVRFRGEESVCGSWQIPMWFTLERQTDGWHIVGMWERI